MNFPRPTIGAESVPESEKQATYELLLNLSLVTSYASLTHHAHEN